MKLHRVVWLVAVLAALLFVLFDAVAATRTVLLEGFTQWNCPPCAQWNPIERRVVNGLTRDTVVVIKYHAWWPGSNNDPMHLWNVAENTARINYYGVNAVPDGYLDGRTSVTRAETTFRNQIRQRRAVAAPCTIEMGAILTSDTTVGVSGTITAVDSAISNTRLFLALISKTFHATGGANGETDFDNPFRDMYPSTNGQTIAVIALDSAYTFTGTLRKAAAWSADSLAVICFLQDWTSKWVHQAAWTPVENAWAVRMTTSDPGQLFSDTFTETEYSLVLENTGNNDDVYTVRAGGTLPVGWTRSIEASDVPADPDEIQVPLGHGGQTLLTLSVNPNGHGGTANLTVEVTSANSPMVHAEAGFRLMAGLEVLLVDDDRGDIWGECEGYYVSSMERVLQDYAWGWWDLDADPLDTGNLQSVRVLIWITGSAPNQGRLSPVEQSQIQSFMDGGGSVFVSGQGIAFDLRTSSFLSQYLHAAHIRPNLAGRSLTGVEGDAIGAGLDFGISGGDGANNQSAQSLIRPADASATPVFHYTNSSGDSCAGLRAETATYKMVFFAFGYEAIDNAADRDSIMARVVRWMYPISGADEPVATVPTEFSVGQNCPNPFNAQTVIPYVLPRTAAVTLRVFDLLGREVGAMNLGPQAAGDHSVPWNGHDLASGLYFYRLEAVAGAARYEATRKLLLLK